MRKAISSISNPLIKETYDLHSKKYRTERSAFIVEGTRCVEEALASGWEIENIFYDESVNSARTRETAEKAEKEGVAVFAVTPEVMKKLSDTETPQGILATVRRSSVDLTGFTDREDGLILIVDEIRDPGNLGTIIRTADAAGITAAVLLAGCADLYAPKTVRATMGSLFHLPLVVNQDKEELITWCRKNDWQIVASSLSGADSIYEFAQPKRCALILGNEASGVSSPLLAAADHKVFVPMRGTAESLNVAVAAGIILFEFLRAGLVTKNKGVL